MKINLHIQQLTLHGVSLTPTDRAELIAAVQAEFGRLVAAEKDNQHWINLRDQDQLNGQEIHHAPGARAIHLGQEIAASLYSSIQDNAAGHQSEVA